jgi:hypothetical protein
LESAIAQPRATFDGADLHPAAHSKAAALGCSLALNHPFIDGMSRASNSQNGSKHTFEQYADETWSFELCAVVNPVVRCGSSS